VQHAASIWGDSEAMKKPTDAERDREIAKPDFISDQVSRARRSYLDLNPSLDTALLTGLSLQLR